MKDYQRTRIRVLLGVEEDRDASYNVTQSKIAIGSGGLLGKGFMNGTQTKLDYVPEQDTDFIFCTVGEEEGFVGAAGVLVLFLLLIWRLIALAERQTSTSGACSAIRCFRSCSSTYSSTSAWYWASPPSSASRCRSFPTAARRFGVSRSCFSSSCASTPDANAEAPTHYLSLSHSLSIHKEPPLTKRSPRPAHIGQSVDRLRAVLLHKT